MLQRHRREISLIAAILAIGVVLAAAAPGFFSFANQRDLLLANMPVLIVALGMVLVILTGQIDISVGSQFAICSVATGVFARMGLPTPLAGVAACLVGALMGGINGALVAWVRIPSIVVTLATMVALRDSLRWITQGAWVHRNYVTKDPKAEQPKQPGGVLFDGPQINQRAPQSANPPAQNANPRAR